MARPRKKKNIPARMEMCSEYWFSVPIANRGKWRKAFGMERAPLFVELGCGKGSFACGFAQAHPDVCFVGVEKDESVLLAAIEKAATLGLRNVRFLHAEAEFLRNYFEWGEIDRIFIHFCDPWIRKNKPKRRLTYRANLEIYRELLTERGRIHLKTDEPALFVFSLMEFWDCGFFADKVTLDLYRSRWLNGNIATEFEAKFVQAGLPIYSLEAHKKREMCEEICLAIPVGLDGFHGIRKRFSGHSSK